MKVETIGSFRGTMVGGYGSFEYRPCDWFYSGASMSWLLGNTTAQQQMDRYIHDLDSKMRVGYTMQLLFWRWALITPFIGLGYDYTVQHFRPDLVINSLKYRWYKYYIPMGMLLEMTVSKNFNFGLNIEWDPQLSSRVKIDGVPGVKWNLARKSGYMVEVPIQGNFSKRNVIHYSVGLVPFLKWNVDGRLDARFVTGGEYHLPEQTYKYWGIRVQFGALF